MTRVKGIQTSEITRGRVPRGRFCREKSGGVKMSVFNTQQTGQQCFLSIGESEVITI